jgi:hypothetical protein
VGEPAARGQGARRGALRARIAHALTHRGAPEQAYVHANPDTTAKPGAEGQRMLAELEKIRQWDVKFHYNRKKKLAAGGAAVVASGAQPSSVPPALNPADTAAARLAARLCGCLRALDV